MDIKGVFTLMTCLTHLQASFSKALTVPTVPMCKFYTT
jgi:hypothetical protein